MFLHTALELPNAQANEDGNHRQGEEAEAEVAPSRRFRHFGSRSIIARFPKPVFPSSNCLSRISESHGQ
jgi:hypothetical protein